MTDLIDQINASAADVEGAIGSEAVCPQPAISQSGPIADSKLKYSQRLQAVERFNAPTSMQTSLLEFVLRTVAGELMGLPKVGSVEVFHGPSDFGKRHVARSIESLPELQPVEAGGTVSKPVIVPEIGPTDDVVSLLLALEQELDPAAAFKPAGKSEDLRDRVYTLLRLRRVRWLIILDAEKLFDEKSESRGRSIAQALAAMVAKPNLALRLVLCGDQAVANWANRSSLRQYANFHKFEELSKDELREFLAGYADLVPDVDVSILKDPEFLKELGVATDSRPGAVVNLIRKAFKELRPAENQLKIGHFRDARRPLDPAEKRLFSDRAQGNKKSKATPAAVAAVGE